MTCNHKPTVRVSSHADLVAAAKTDDAVASVYCCDREACQVKAKRWVAAEALCTPVVVPLCRAAVSRRAADPQQLELLA